MAPRRRDLRILLLQIRDEAKVRREEHESFARYAGLGPEQIAVHNVFDRPQFGPEILEGFDALFVGGASEANVLEPERFPFLGPSRELLRHVAERGLPCFASCFGFQLAVLALGGTIRSVDEGFEMGTLPIRLTAEAAGCPLFGDTPDGFLAVSVHRQLADAAPPGAVPLAETDACLHSFRVGAQPFWAFQFHPEVDRQTLVERLTVFKTHYTEGDDHLDAVLADARETPESNALVRKFVDRVLLSG